MVCHYYLMLFLQEGYVLLENPNYFYDLTNLSKQNYEVKKLCCKKVKYIEIMSYPLNLYGFIGLRYGLKMMNQI